MLQLRCCIYYLIYNHEKIIILILIITLIITIKHLNCFIVTRTIPGNYSTRITYIVLVKPIFTEINFENKRNNTCYQIFEEVISFLKK